MIGIAIIGCGSITRVRHAPECRSNPNIRLCGFFDRNTERCQILAEEYQCKAYASYEEVLNDEDVVGVIICTANKYHCEMTMQAFACGKHVLCEKPIAVTSKEAQDMINSAEKEGKYLMIAHNQRFDPVHQKLKQIVESGMMGRIISFRSVFAHGGPDNWCIAKNNKTWFLDKNQAGLGVMGDLGVHKTDLMRWLLNDDFAYVTAKVYTLDKCAPDGTRIALDDNAFCILETKSGIIGTLEVSWTHYGESTCVTELYCEKGIVNATSGVSEQIVIHMKDGSIQRFSIPGKVSGIVDAFANSIINNIIPEIDGNEGKYALDVVLKCIESSEKNMRLAL